MARNRGSDDGPVRLCNCRGRSWIRGFTPLCTRHTSEGQGPYTHPPSDRWCRICVLLVKLTFSHLSFFFWIYTSHQTSEDTPSCREHTLLRRHSVSERRVDVSCLHVTLPFSLTGRDAGNTPRQGIQRCYFRGLLSVTSKRATLVVEVRVDGSRSRIKNE